MIDYEAIHNLTLRKYSDKIEELFNAFGKEVAKIANEPAIRAQLYFSFSDNVKLSNRILKLRVEFTKQLEKVITEGIKKEWALANLKNDALIASTIRNVDLINSISAINEQNITALTEFIGKSTNGLKLSDRVWKMGEQYQSEIERHLQIGITRGESAASIAKKIKANLKNPDVYFRTAKKKDGSYILSANDRDIRTGRGVYKSSFKNARRTALTEINDSYRLSDHNRRMKNPTIIGYEVKLSNNHPVPDMCDHLKGKYPKSFVFKKWHIQCRCYATAIMLTDVEFDRYQDAILSGTEDDFDVTKSANYVKKMPKNYNDWISENSEKLQRLNRYPDFIEDNYKNGDLLKGFKVVK